MNFGSHFSSRSRFQSTFFSPRRSSIESFGYYHFLRVDDYGAGAEAVGLASSSLREGGLGDESETDRIMKLLDD